MLRFRSFISEATTKRPAPRIRRVSRRIRRNASGQIVVQRNLRVRGRQLRGYKLVRIGDSPTAVRVVKMSPSEIRKRSARNPNRRKGFRKIAAKRAIRLRKWKQSMSRRKGW